MRKLWGFINMVGLLLAAGGFIAKSAVLIGLGIAVAALAQWQKGRAE